MSKSDEKNKKNHQEAVAKKSVKKADKKPTTGEEPSAYEMLDTAGSRTVLLLSGTALVFAIVALSIWGWIYFRWDSVKGQTEKALTQAREQYIEQNATLKKVQKQVDQSVALYQRQKDFIDEQLATISAAVDRQKPLSVDTLLSEGQHLLKLAQYNIYYQQDPQASFTLVKEALDRISKVGDGRFLGLREQINQVLLELGQAANVDMSGTLSTLNALSNEIPNLPLAPVGNGEKIDLSSVSDPNSAAWKQNIQSNLGKIQNIVEIRRHDQAVQPLMTTEQRQQLDQRVQLLLGQAQWGLLHRDKSIYEDSLGQANLLIQTYYLAQDAATTGVVRELTALTNTVITPNMPDLEPIIRQLEQTTVNNAPQQGR